MSDDFDDEAGDREKGGLAGDGVLVGASYKLGQEKRNKKKKGNATQAEACAFG